MSGHDNIPPETREIPISAGAVSVYGQGGALDDFPVLKAFQQYVDAEQAKAHKRLMSVCLFFTFLILVMTGVFLFVIFNMNSKSPFEDATIKALSDNNAALQKQVLDQTVKMNEQLMSRIASDRDRPSAADAELQRANLELQAKLNALEIENRLKAEQRRAEERRRAEEAAKAAKTAAEAPKMSDADKAALERELKKAEAAQKAKEAKLAEREKRLADEAARLKEKEKQLQRRKLYPEYFDDDGNELPHPVRTTAATPAVVGRVAPNAPQPATPQDGGLRASRPTKVDPPRRPDVAAKAGVVGRVAPNAPQNATAQNGGLRASRPTNAASTPAKGRPEVAAKAGDRGLSRDADLLDELDAILPPLDDDGGAIRYFDDDTVDVDGVDFTIPLE